MEDEISLDQNCGASPSLMATDYSEEKPKHNKQMVFQQWPIFFS
jgi:hypothetical protein